VQNKHRGRTDQLVWIRPDRRDTWPGCSKPENLALALSPADAVRSRRRACLTSSEARHASKGACSGLQSSPLVHKDPGALSMAEHRGQMRAARCDQPVPGVEPQLRNQGRTLYTRDV